MSTELSTVVKRYFAILKDGRQIPIDEIDKMHIENAKANGRFSAFVQIGSGSKKYNGEVSQIIEISEVRTQKYQGKGFYCDFGTFHPVHENCTCVKTCKVSPIVFRSLSEIRFQKHPKFLTKSQKASLIDSLT